MEERKRRRKGKKCYDIKEVNHRDALIRTKETHSGKPGTSSGACCCRTPTIIILRDAAQSFDLKKKRKKK